MHALTQFITEIITRLGYPGVFVWMLLESACIPIPSEVVMPFAGAMIATKHAYNLHALAFTGALGNLAGSILAYKVGAWKGRGFFEKYGKYVLITREDLDLADHWFQKHGQATVFFTRILPVIRTFISLPAGISGMPFGRFCAYTFAGALGWCYFLTWIGLTLGQHWDTVGKYFHEADGVIAVLLIIMIVLWGRRHTKKDKAPAATG